MTYRRTTTSHPSPLPGVLAACLLALGLMAPAPARAETVPSGYAVVERHGVAAGVEVLHLRGDGVSTRVAVIEAGADVELRPILSGEEVGASPERTSSMCARIDCLVAVNADFVLPGTGQPVGGVVRDGVLLKSPSHSHHQLTVARDGALAADAVEFRARLVPTDLEPIAVDAVNAPRREGELVLYTPAYGPRTGTNRVGVELVLRTVQPGGPLILGETVVVELVDMREGSGDAPIPGDGAVLSAHADGAGRLLELWGDIEAGEVSRRALVRVDSVPRAFQSVGGTPILLRDGEVWFGSAPTDFVRGRHPRTVVGWNDAGERFLVTVDGRQPGHSVGMTLAEAADFMLGLGATDAINLDGGGSSTFVVDGGEVLNRPSDRVVERDGRQVIVQAPVASDTVVGLVERPVTTALAVVPSRGDAVAPVDPLAGGDVLDLPRIESPPPTRADPASNPYSDLPALVATTPRPGVDPRWAATAVGTLALVTLAWGALRPRPRPRPVTVRRSPRSGSVR